MLGRVANRLEPKPLLARLSPYLPTAILACLIFYFGFQVLTGPGGLLLLAQRNAHLAARRAELAALQNERLDLEARSKLLRDGQISRDLVEERARYLLGFSDPRDYVIRTRP